MDSSEMDMSEDSVGNITRSLRMSDVVSNISINTTPSTQAEFMSSECITSPEGAANLTGHSGDDDQNDNEMNRSIELDSNYGLDDSGESIGNAEVHENEEQADIGNLMADESLLQNEHESFGSDLEDNLHDSMEDEDDLQQLLEEDATYNLDYQFPQLAEMLRKEEANVEIQAHVIVSLVEMLLGILKFSEFYKLSNSAIADLCRMINTFLDRRVLPDSRYRIDKLFYPQSNQLYHAVCPTCKLYLGQFETKTRSLFCNVCQVHVNLKDPSYRDFFVTLDIRNNIKNLIESNDTYYTNIMTRDDDVGNDGNLKDIYDGKKYCEFVSSLPEAKRKSYATLTFNSDGSPVFKSSRFSIWPIQVIVNELPSDIRHKKPIVHSVWFGHDKPNMLYFLRPFVEAINDLSENGIECTIDEEKKIIYVYALCCCVDSVARAPMQGTTQFNGYYGCNWCLHPGERIIHNTGGTIKYTLLDEIPEKRTGNGTLEHLQRAIRTEAAVYGVKKATPLLNLNNFDIITGFVPDAMHCIDLGVAKQFMDYWFGSTRMPYSIPKEYIEMIDKRIKALKVPTQLMRLSRSLSDRKYWKAKEYQNWILYYSTCVLAEVPGFQEYLRHWALLVEAYHILLKEEISSLDISIADRLLRRFVAETQFYYGEDAMSFNVHQLLHVGQSVADWGPIWTHSGYPFESGNGNIIKSVHAANGVLSQVCRNLSFKMSIFMLEKHVNSREYSVITGFVYYIENRVTMNSLRLFECRYFGNPTLVQQSVLDHLSLTQGEAQAFNKIVRDNCVFQSYEKQLYRSDNAYARLRNGDFIHIQQFIIDRKNNIEYIAYRKVNVQNVNNICTELTHVKELVDIPNNTYISLTSQLDKLSVHMTINTRRFILSIPKMFWR